MLNDAVHKYNSKEKSNVRCCNCNKLVLKHNNYKSEDGKYFCNHNCYVKYKDVIEPFECIKAKRELLDLRKRLKYATYDALELVSYIYDVNVSDVQKLKNCLAHRDKTNALKYNKQQILAMIRYMYEKNIYRDKLEDQLDNFPDIVTWDIGRVVNDYRRLIWNIKYLKQKQQ